MVGLCGPNQTDDTPTLPRSTNVQRLRHSSPKQLKRHGPGLEHCFGSRLHPSRQSKRPEREALLFESNLRLTLGWVRLSVRSRHFLPVQPTRARLCSSNQLRLLRDLEARRIPCYFSWGLLGGATVNTFKFGFITLTHTVVQIQTVTVKHSRRRSIELSIWQGRCSRRPHLVSFFFFFRRLFFIWVFRYQINLILVCLRSRRVQGSAEITAVPDDVKDCCRSVSGRTHEIRKIAKIKPGPDSCMGAITTSYFFLPARQIQAVDTRDEYCRR